MTNVENVTGQNFNIFFPANKKWDSRKKTAPISGLWYYFTGLLSAELR